MKKSIRNLFVLLLAGILLLNPMVAEAARFSDVNQGHWAYEFIEELTEKNVIKGYPNGQFKPDNYVSYLEILELLKGVKDVPKTEMSRYVTKHKTTLEKYGVPAWAHEAVAVALEENIITVDNLTAAYSQGLITDFPKDGQYPNRETIAVYYAKALGMKGSEDHSLLKYKDINEIGVVNNQLIDKTNVKNYLADLISNGIFADTGSDGNFEPRRPLRRAEMAKITSKSYQYAHRVTNDLEGRIIHVGDVYARNLIFIEDAKGSSYTLVLDDNTKIKIDDKVGKYDDLKVNQKVTAKVTGNIANKELLHAVELNVKTDKVVGTGIIESIDNEKVKINYAEKFQAIHPFASLETPLTGEFGYDKDMEIVQIDQAKKFVDLGKNMHVRFIAENGLITKIYIVPSDAYVNGTVVEVKSDTKFEREGKLTLKLANDTEYDFYVDNQQRFGIKPSQLKTLSKGDKVKIRVFYDFIGELNDNVYPDKTSGYIQDVITRNNSYHEITLVQLDGKAIKLKVDQGTSFNDNGFANRPLNSDTLNDLRQKRTRVDVTILGDRVTKLTATDKTVTPVSGTIYTTTIDQFYDENNYTYDATIYFNDGSVRDVVIKNPQGLELRKNYRFDGFQDGSNIVATIDGLSDAVVLQISK